MSGSFVFTGLPKCPRCGSIIAGPHHCVQLGVSGVAPAAPVPSPLYDRLVADKVREQRDRLIEAVEDVRGNLHLWQIGEIDAETAMQGVREAVEDLPWYVGESRVR